MADLTQLMEELIRFSQEEKSSNAPYIQVKNYPNTTST